MTQAKHEYRIRVLHIITKLELGGAQQNTLYTVSHLDTKRYRPYLIAGPGGILDSEAKTFTGVDFRTAQFLRRKINPVGEWKGYRELRRMIRDIAPDIVHTHSSKAGVLGRLAAAKEHVPVIIHSIHGFGIDAVKNPLIQKILLAAERRAAKHTTHFISVSQQNIEDGRRFGLFDVSNVSKIYSGIKLDTFRSAKYRPELRIELGIPDDAPVVGNISCLKPQKNPVAFVDVAAMVHAQIPEARFLLVGDGILKEQVEQKIQELNLQDAFIMAGWRRDIAQLLKLMNVFVLTSIWEGLPRVISESLSAEVPVVVTRAGGSAEAVQDGVTGYVVEQGELEHQADKIVHLLKNRNIAKKMGTAGPESVKAWDIDQMVKAQEELYEKLLEI